MGRGQTRIPTYNAIEGGRVGVLENAVKPQLWDLEKMPLTNYHLGSRILALMLCTYARQSGCFSYLIGDD